jgi:hypothetical protein
MEKWHIFALGLAMIVLGLVLNGEVGLESTIIYEILILAIIGGAYVIVNVARKRGKKQGFYFRGDITPEKAKYIAAKHLELHAHLPLFIADNGNEDLEYTRYMVPLKAERCYPSSGEEAWVVKAIIDEERFFDGQHTKILVYVDGGGRVMNEEYMNAKLGFNERLWKNPNLYFREIVPKTARPMSMQEVIAEKMRESGEVSEAMASAMLRGEEGE